MPGTVPYAELHCHSNYSFLDGASHPEELATEAARLGLEALAITDHNGFYGVVRFAEAARAVGLPTVFGAEITLTPGLADDHHVARTEADTLFQVDTGQVPDSHAPDPAGRHLLRARRRADRVRQVVAGTEPRSSGGREGGATVHVRRHRRRGQRGQLGVDRLS